MNVFGLAADLTVALHAVFALFVAFGGLLALRWRRVMWAHLPAAAWGVLIEFGGWICPLTPLENQLRQRAGDRAYPGDFIQHYLLPALYPAHLTRAAQVAIGSAALVFNIIVYRRLFAGQRAG